VKVLDLFCWHATRRARKIDLFEPPELAPGFISAVLDAVGHEVDEAAIGAWTLAERVLAYDYAVRVRIQVGALANETSCALELRPCPSFVIAADAGRGLFSCWLQLMKEERRDAATV